MKKTKNDFGKKGQISTEVIYSVGVMIVIFLLLTGITFNRRMDVRKSDDYLNKRTECLKISNTVSSLSSSGDGTQRIIQIIYNVTITNQSRIIVSETGATPKTVEAVCTYTGNTAGAEIAGLGQYIFNNTKGVVYINKA
ncbi:MAG: hypothetical protein AABW64_00255 [Nanoarchaeota archaeon]